ncbi:MAG TPA: HNH endonuclease signature motif containing protein, partial [Marmoricola sp.]|nr:HNH endonuclease signature motif containing protein [Marmoricola sp.]
ERVTGQATAGAVPVEVALVLPEQTLLRGGDEPAELAGAGPVPAAVARALVTDPDTKVWLRRVYTRPTDGSLVAMDSTRRRFPTGLRRLIQTRDRTCRTPWCGAPIRHTDHVVPVAQGGQTSAANGQGLCEACNYTKQAPGWTARPAPGPAGAGDRVQTTTPTGHTYPSHPPPLPHARPPGDDRSLIEEHFRRLIHAA